MLLSVFQMLALMRRTEHLCKAIPPPEHFPGASPRRACFSVFVTCCLGIRLLLSPSFPPSVEVVHVGVKPRNLDVDGCSSVDVLKKTKTRFWNVSEDSFQVGSSRVSVYVHIYVCIYLEATYLQTALLSLLGPITATWVALETWKFCCLWLLLLLDLLLCTCMRCLAYPACWLSPIYLFISI